MDNGRFSFREMGPEDAGAVVPLDIDYYNACEGGQWTEETAGRRIRQVLGMDGGWGLLLEEDGQPAGFVMGYFKPYDDLTSFVLEEIVISRARQGKGLGTLLLAEVERRVQELGASGVELSAVNDEVHHRFYSRAGYRDVQNFVPKVKWFSS
ncbi:GNAT family N-acetyltransferase [Acutalibacter intestini]|uniref:GNAT family N-acetyltransferase n=1 Tax=Acutalibacter intestini TaxID=3093659 RepID=UPI002AC9D381|nr:GNAT family N-acetyltransferase [Acutalibacter sp. M00204]